MRATLEITRACDNRCIFCAQRGLPSEVAGPSLETLRATADEVTFVGGEPGLVPELPMLIRQARALGFVAVGIQTNGHGLDRAAELAEAGLTDVHVSLHGAEARVHDYHTGVDGSFVRLVAGVARARAARLTVAATTVVTRSNCRVMSELPRFLLQRGISAWLVSVPTVAGAAATDFDRVVPRLGLAMPFVLHALAAARAMGLPAYVDGAPLCLLGPFAERALPSLPRAYGAACEGCAARAQCPGVDALYLARFGGDELRPRAAQVGSAHSLFVGVGATMPVAREMPAPPSEIRRGLPLYGKVQPASAEAARGAPKQSGEALRTIFPALFSADGSEGSDGKT